LNTLRQQDMYFSPQVNVRLAAGLSLQVTGSLSLTRNQPYLANGGLTEADILLQQQQLATNYTYLVLVGFNYTFGSAFTDVVFPRFITGGVL
jgi:hypothetical protein